MINSSRLSSLRRPLPLWFTAAVLVLVSRLLLFALYLQWKRSSGSDDGFFTALYHWDAGWYASIVSNGYGGEAGLAANAQARWAFFPLVPLLDTIVTHLTGLKLQVAGVLLNTVFLYLITLFGAKYMRELDCGPGQALIFMLLVNFGPYNVYYSTLYTEAAFVLLVCLALYCLQTRHWLLMGLFGALASATRNTGIFLVFAVALWCLLTYLDQKEPPRKKGVKDFVLWVLQKPRLILGTFLIPMGLFLYMHYLDGLLGDGMAFVHVQYAWGRVVGNPITHLYKALLDIGSGDFFLGVCTLVCLYLCARQIVRRRPEAILSLLFIVIPLSTSIAGMTRYTLCSFPILVEASHELSCKSRLSKAFWALFLLIFGVGTSLKWFQAAQIMI